MPTGVESEFVPCFPLGSCVGFELRVWMIASIETGFGSSPEQVFVSGAEVVKKMDGSCANIASEGPRQARFDEAQRWFHQGWCNSQSYVNEALQSPQIVLVSDPIYKDSEHAAQQIFSKLLSRIFSGKSIVRFRQSA
jgi:hypothetical protein